MKERPILMSGPRVREVLADRKTQTRRPAKGAGDLGPMACSFSRTRWARCANRETMECTCQPVACPYEADRLWVRETFTSGTFNGGQPWIRYRATDENDIPTAVRWTPGIHMPRWACRLVLEVLDLRAERLQEITEEDARAEGVADRAAFEAKWIEIYGRESWAANPWVWVITFRRVEGA